MPSVKKQKEDSFSPFSTNLVFSNISSVVVMVSPDLPVLHMCMN